MKRLPTEKKTCLSLEITPIYFHLKLTTTFSLHNNRLFRRSELVCSDYYKWICKTYYKLGIRRKTSVIGDLYYTSRWSFKLHSCSIDKEALKLSGICIANFKVHYARTVSLSTARSIILSVWGILNRGSFSQKSTERFLMKMR